MIKKLSNRKKIKKLPKLKRRKKIKRKLINSVKTKKPNKKRKMRKQLKERPNRNKKKNNRKKKKQMINRQKKEENSCYKPWKNRCKNLLLLLNRLLQKPHDLHNHCYNMILIQMTSLKLRRKRPEKRSWRQTPISKNHSLCP